MNKYPYNAVHYSSTGFILLKSQPAGNLVCETYKSTALPTLQRECGVFFDTSCEAPLISLRFSAPLLIPKGMYQAPATQYLRLQNEVSDSDEVFENEIDDYVAVFAVPFSKTLPLRTTLANPQFRHCAVNLYRYLAQYNSSCPNKLLVNFDGDKMGFILIKNDKLFLINELTFTEPSDALYYVLNILQQNDAKRAESEVLVCGLTPEMKKINQLLSQYLPNVVPAGKELKLNITDLKGQKVDISTCLQLIEI